MFCARIVYKVRLRHAPTHNKSAWGHRIKFFLCSGILDVRIQFSSLARLLAPLIAAASFAVIAPAAAIEVNQFAVFVNSPTLGAQSLEDTQVGVGLNEMAAAGLDVAFSSTLNADNVGTVNWLISNNTGVALLDVDFFGFLDAEIDEPGNSFFNEFGTLIDVSGTGSADTAADSWEIDEPGFLFGNIFNNLLAGALDEANAVPAGLEDDVSLALGFELGDVLAGERILATFELSRADIGGLSHTDPDSAMTFFFNGSAQVLPASVAVTEPGTFALLSMVFLLSCSRLPVLRRVSRLAKGAPCG